MDTLRNPNDPIHVNLYRNPYDLERNDCTRYSLVASVTDSGTINYTCRKVHSGGKVIGAYSEHEELWAVKPSESIGRNGGYELPRVNQQGWQDELLGWLDQWHYFGTEHEVYTVLDVKYGTARA